MLPSRKRENCHELKPFKRRRQIVDQVFDILNPSRIADQPFRDSQSSAFFRCAFHVTAGCRRGHDRFHCSQVPGGIRKTEARDKPPDRVEAVFFHQEAQDSAESFHLLPGEGMTGMRLKPGVKHPLHRRMGFEELSNAKALSFCRLTRNSKVFMPRSSK